MNEVESGSPVRRTFLHKFILILLLVQLVDNAIIFFILNTLVKNPGIPQFRLICSISQVIILVLFIFLVKPSAKELGLYWHDIKQSTKYLYITGGTMVLLLVISSYFVMVDIKLYALMTNINFGIATPLLEETVFRGYSWSKFREQGFSNLKTLIFTSIFFGLFHLGYYYQISYATQFHPDAPPMVNIMFMKVIFTVMLGLFLGFIRGKSKKLYGPIIAHSLLNIFSK
jgi:membrane protease YdiL (CAAX protease family)